MPRTAERWTANIVRALPDDGNRYEVIDGELFVTPAPSLPHQRAVGRILVRLDNYLRDKTWGEVMIGASTVPRHDGQRPAPAGSTG